MKRPIPMQEGEPEQNGTYVAYVPGLVQGVSEQKVLVWYEGEWSFCQSDQRYRGQVLGFIGPLQPLMIDRWSFE